MTGASHPRVAMLRAVVHHIEEHPGLWTGEGPNARRADLLVPRRIADAAFVAEYRRVRRVVGH